MPVQRWITFDREWHKSDNGDWVQWDDVKALLALLELAVSALPDSNLAGPDGTGYKWAWDELTGEEQDWVKSVRQRIAEAVRDDETTTTTQA